VREIDLLACRQARSGQRGRCPKRRREEGKNGVHRHRKKGRREEGKKGRTEEGKNGRREEGKKGTDLMACDASRSAGIEMIRESMTVMSTTTIEGV
jgi:hypothetical protein